MNCRKDFSILNIDDTVYLDSAATSLTPDCVLEKIGDYYQHYNANIHRGIHNWAETATAAYEGVRSIIANFILTPGVEDSEIVFTSGTTHGINIVANSFCTNWDSNDQVIISEAEHHANIIPWQQLRDRSGVQLQVVSLNEKGYLEFDQLVDFLKRRCNRSLVAMSVLPNATGVMQDWQKIGQIAKMYQANVLLDGAQSVPRIQTDVSDCDFLVFSGHKTYGPTGTGVLYAKKGLLDQCPPYMGGGDMIKTVSFDQTTFNEMPWRYEAGTPNIAGIIGLGRAIEWIKEQGLDDITAHETSISDYAQEALKSVERVSVFFPQTAKLGLVVFSVDSAQSSDVATLLNTQQIAVRSGFLCAEPILRNRVGQGVLRASFGCYTTTEEIDKLVAALHKVLSIL